MSAFSTLHIAVMILAIICVMNLIALSTQSMKIDVLEMELLHKIDHTSVLEIVRDRMVHDIDHLTPEGLTECPPEFEIFLLVSSTSYPSIRRVYALCSAQSRVEYRIPFLLHTSHSTSRSQPPSSPLALNRAA